MAKRRASHYQPGVRSDHWRRIKRPGWQEGRTWRDEPEPLLRFDRLDDSGRKLSGQAVSRSHSVSESHQRSDIHLRCRDFSTVILHSDRVSSSTCITEYSGFLAAIDSAVIHVTSSISSAASMNSSSNLCLSREGRRLRFATNAYATYSSAATHRRNFWKHGTPATAFNTLQSITRDEPVAFA